MPKQNESRFAVCSVGEGFSVEDRRTGERIGWYKARSTAEKIAETRRNICKDVSKHVTYKKDDQDGQ